MEYTVALFTASMSDVATWTIMCNIDVYLSLKLRDVPDDIIALIFVPLCKQPYSEKAPSRHVNRRDMIFTPCLKDNIMPSYPNSTRSCGLYMKKKKQVAMTRNSVNLSGVLIMRIRFMESVLSIVSFYELVGECYDGPPFIVCGYKKQHVSRRAFYVSARPFSPSSPFIRVPRRYLITNDYGLACVPRPGFMQHLATYAYDSNLSGEDDTYVDGSVCTWDYITLADVHGLTIESWDHETVHPIPLVLEKDMSVDEVSAFIEHSSHSTSEEGSDDDDDDDDDGFFVDGLGRTYANNPTVMRELLWVPRPPPD